MMPLPRAPAVRSVRPSSSSAEAAGELGVGLGFDDLCQLKHGWMQKRNAGKKIVKQGN